MQKATTGELARAVELILAVVAFATAAFGAYDAYEFARQAIVTREWLLRVAPAAFLIFVLEGTVMVLGLRLAFARFRPQGRIVAPGGVAGYVVVCLSLFAIAWWRDDRFPPQAWPFLAGSVIGLLAFLSQRHSR